MDIPLQVPFEEQSLHLVTPLRLENVLFRE